MYTKFTQDFPIVTIEDPFDQDDWDHTAAFTAEGVCQVQFPPSTNISLCFVAVCEEDTIELAVKLTFKAHKCSLLLHYLLHCSHLHHDSVSSLYSITLTSCSQAAAQRSQLPTECLAGGLVQHCIFDDELLAAAM